MKRLALLALFFSVSAHADIKPLHKVADGAPILPSSGCFGPSCTLPSDGTVLVSSGPLIAQSSSTNSGAIVQAWYDAAHTLLGSVVNSGLLSWVGGITASGTITASSAAIQGVTLRTVDGKVGIGTAAPGTKFHCSTCTGTFDGTGAAVNIDDSSNNPVLSLKESGVAKGGIQSASGVTYVDGTNEVRIRGNGSSTQFRVMAAGDVSIPGPVTSQSSGTWTNVIAATTFTITNLSSPAAADACTAGTITVDTGFIYVCSASGAWKRVAVTGGY